MSPTLPPVGPLVRLRPFRVLRGYTLDQLVERIAEQGVTITISHASNVERGRQRASGRLLRAWALALGLDPLDVWQPERAPDDGANSAVTETTAA